MQQIVDDQDKKTPSPVLLSYSTKIVSVENTCNLARLGKNWNKFNFFEAHKIDLRNKMRTAIEIIGTRILIKELGEIKVWIGIKLFIKIK